MAHRSYDSPEYVKYPTEALIVRVPYPIKRKLEKIAHKDHRTLTSLTVKILADWIEENGE